MKLYCLSGNPNAPCFVLKFKQVTIMLDCGLSLGSMMDFLPISLTNSGQFVRLPGWSPPSLPGGVKLHDELKDVTGKIFVDSEPEFGIPEMTLLDMSEVDIILISNHHCMMALPYLTEYTAFRGVVYCTDPTLHIGRLHMEELVEYIKRNPKPGRAMKWKQDNILHHLPPPLKDAIRPASWRQIYNKHDIHACLARVKVVTFNEKLDIFGSLTVTPYSSGYSLGSCNWVLHSHFEKIVYISGSSTLTTHPKQLEQSPLKNADVMLMTRLTQTPTCNPDSMIGEFCINTGNAENNQCSARNIPGNASQYHTCWYPVDIRRQDTNRLGFLMFSLGHHFKYSETCLERPHVRAVALDRWSLFTAMTLRNGGNVLVPCYPSGVTYDLFECLSRHLESCNLITVPMYFISPVADSSLAYSNIYAEWLSKDKSSKVYLPEPPFPHAELVKTNQLIHVPDLHSLSSELKVPCVVFTGHPSLRVGDVVHFLELWGKQSANTLIITEPDFPYLEALAPYQPLSMKVSYCPIDTSLSFTQANKLIRELKPVHLATSAQYVTPPVMYPHNGNLMIECEPAPVTYRQVEVLTLPVRRTYEQIELDPVIASGLLPTEVKPGVAIATITGELVGRDHKYLLQPLPEQGGMSRKRRREGGDSHPKSYHWGSLDVNEFVQHLNKTGIVDVKVEEGPSGGHIVHLPSEDTLIQIEEGSTHIICEGNEELRIKLKDTLLKCLAKF